MHKHFGALLFLLLLLVPSVWAQDEIIETTVGPITVNHPESWNVLEGPAGTVVIAEFDPSTITAENPMPDDAVVIQLRLFGLNRIAGLVDDDLTATNIAGGLLSNDPSMEGEELPEIAEIEGQNYSFARVDVSTEELASYVYVSIFSDATFGIITASSAGGIDIIDANEASVLGILDTMTLTFETPLPEDAFSRYLELQQSVTAEGFPMLGDPTAPVTIMEIGSFDCPHCRTFHDVFFPIILGRVKQGEVNFIYVPIYGTGSYPLGDSAARASLCVGAENFWAFHDVLFSWQDLGAFAFLYERLQDGAANTAAVPPTTFDACYTSPVTNAVLEAARQQTFNVLGQNWRTPTIVINGTILENISDETLLEAIDNAIDASQQ